MNYIGFIYYCLFRLFAASFCRYSTFGGIQCFCPYTSTDIRPLNGTQCTGEFTVLTLPV